MDHTDALQIPIKITSLFCTFSSPSVCVVHLSLHIPMHYRYWEVWTVRGKLLITFVLSGFHTRMILLSGIITELNRYVSGMLINGVPLNVKSRFSDQVVQKNKFYFILLVYKYNFLTRWTRNNLAQILKY